MSEFTAPDVYEAVTGGVVVRAAPVFLPEQSEPAERRWVWAYEIEIENRGRSPVQLVSRRWTITDAFGRVEEVQGPGVVGEQPVIRPGESFRYTSGCPLSTASGAMVGAYRMVDDAGEMFEVDIPAFSLDVPSVRRTVN